jgi:hypothetical protein
MKISMENITTVEFKIDRDKYPAGMSPDVALALELEQASQYPHEYVAMQGAVTSVVGQLARDNGQPLRMRDRLHWALDQLALKAFLRIGGDRVEMDNSGLGHSCAGSESRGEL